MQKERCSVCGYDQYTGSLQVHHKDRNHDNNSSDNLIVLCANCHFEEHSKDVERKLRNSKCHNLKNEYQTLIQLHNIALAEYRKELEALQRQLTEHVPMR